MKYTRVLVNNEIHKGVNNEKYVDYCRVICYQSNECATMLKCEIDGKV